MAETGTTELIAQLRRRPAVHRLTYGAFIQGHFWLDDRMLILPLAAMGFSHGVSYTVRYHTEIIGFPPEEAAVAQLQAQGAGALPVIAFVHFPAADTSPEVLEENARPALERAEQIVGWITGDFLTDFAYLTGTNEKYHFRVVPPHSRRRMLLGPGNVGSPLADNIKRLAAAADADERFSFALAMYRDSLHERNKLFKISRLFGVLEALAYALKVGGVGSRTAIRTMLGLQAGATGEISYGGRTVRFERIELAGRLRDRIFHGVPFERNDLSVESRDSFDLLSDQPDQLISALMSDCELEFARWANNASVARTKANALQQK